MMIYPGVGVCVYIRRSGKILFGKRLSEHGKGTWCPPGGKLDMYETWEDCARRETREETGVEITNIRFAAVTNDIWNEIGTHYVTIAMVADWKVGEPRLVEADKFETWDWFVWDSLPETLLLSARNFVKSGYNPFTI